MPVVRLKDFKRWDYYSTIEQKLQIVDASNTPFITYDNGVPCYEANMYMHQQLITVKSRKVKGGTLRTYANCIIQLVSFCYQNQIQFSQLTDSTFTLFVQGLQAERDKLGELKRSNNRVIDIAHRCLCFLKFTQELHDIENFVGIDKKNAIRIQIKKYSIAIEGSKSKAEGELITHACVPTKDAVKRKLPVSTDSALKVWNFIQNQENYEKRIRDIALYQCMEQLGARVTEIHLITMDDVKNALESGVNPYLRLTNLKRKDGKTTRNIPITLALLTDINHYTKVRKKVLKKLQRKSKGSKILEDHGYLFISLTTGNPLQGSTLTTYMNKWKHSLGIVGELHPHLYRHAFITNKLKEIILHYKEINSADKFREHLLHTEKFKMQLQQWTGHTHLHSLDTYINLVFADINGYSKIYNAVALKDSVTIVKRQIASIKKRLRDHEVTMTDGVLMIEEILTAFECDINNSLGK